MKKNGKIKSTGYDRRSKTFLGWRVDKERSLKYVHPSVKEEIEAIMKKRSEL